MDQTEFMISWKAAELLFGRKLFYKSIFTCIVGKDKGLYMDSNGILMQVMEVNCFIYCELIKMMYIKII